MKLLIKLIWEDLKSLFSEKKPDYYTLSTNADVQKTPCQDTEKEDLLEPAIDSAWGKEPHGDLGGVIANDPKPVRTKAQLKALSKLELQVIAQNEGVTLSGKENKQQIVNKLAKLAL
jgi:hypothetical protein